MKTEIFLAGSGLTRFGEWWDKSLGDLMKEAVASALESAKMDPKKVDLVIVANMLADATNGQSHLGAAVSAYLPHNPPAIRVESACASGALAVHTACAFLESGRAKNVLVVGAEKMTDASGDAVSEALMGAADGELDTPSGITFPGIFGLIAQRYMYEFGLSRDELSLVSAVHHKNALENPFAQFHQKITPAMVSESPLVSDPLRLLDCSPITDGAAACILSTTVRSGLRINASQIANDVLSLAERTDIVSFSATRRAMEAALKEGAINRAEVSAIETHDCFSIAAIVNIEDMGFAEKGKGIEVYKAAHSELGSMSVNQSGGLKACGHPIAATGLKQIIDIGKTLTKQKKRFGLAHNIGGVGASCGIHIIENFSI